MRMSMIPNVLARLQGRPNRLCVFPDIRTAGNNREVHVARRCGL